jgi:hypothetical protein
MNREAWEETLRKAGLLEEYRDVLRGFDQGIPIHQIEGKDYFTPEDHTLALLAREEIEEKLATELKARRIFGPYTHAQVMKRYLFFCTNPYGAVVNGDGSTRAIDDLSFPRGKEGIPSVNSFVNKDDYKTTWDDFKIVSQFFRAAKTPVQLAIFDREKAYWQVPTAKDQWPFLMIPDFNRKLYIDTQIAFGGVAGCGSFGRPADAWKDIMQSEFNLVEVFRWVNKNLFVKDPDTELQMDQIVARCYVLGNP